jgi:Ca-activated chloride channel family protein
MLATDLAPSRLERAKLWVRDLAASLKGDRVALVTFAGAARVECPLTLDRAFFRMTLDEASPDDIQLGGTAIGDAIRKAVRDVFELAGTAPPPGASARDIILITDGEDHESLPTEAAAAAGKLGVRIIAIGLGDPAAGATVPGDDQRPLRRDGQIVRSRMDAQALADIAAATPGGVFLNVGTGTISLDTVYRDLIATSPQVTTGTSTFLRHRELFRWPLLAAVALLALEPLIPLRRRTRPLREAAA